jgi:hypothetical protein
MPYQFTFSTEQVQALWTCIMQAPLPRAMTDDLAGAFRRQVEEQNQAAEAAAKAKANGHDSTSPPS